MSGDELRVDVAVVGGGPAGAVAARYSAMEGVDTLLIDRRRVPGVPVQCGEFLPSEAVLKKMMPEARELDDLLEPCRNTISMRTDTIKIVSPKGKEYVLPFEGMTIDRDRFDARLVEKAEKAGARVMLGTAVRAFDGTAIQARVLHGKDKGRSIEVKAKVVIGADGPHSLIRKATGIPGPKQLSPCVQWSVKGDFEPTVEMHFGSVAPSGYAWVIPKAGSANIGLGVTGCPEGGMNQLLRAFLDKKGIDVGDGPIRKTGGHVPSTGPVPITAVENIVLVGDAAGHVMATNGGGVPTALIGGRLAGLSAARHLRSRMDLEAYERAWEVEMGTILRNSSRTRALAGLAFGSDRRLEMAMALMGENGMRRALTCKRPFVLF